MLDTLTQKNLENLLGWIMKLNLIILIIILAFAFSMVSCGENKNITNPISVDTIGVAIGTNETFDVVTWNIESFPKHNPETTNLLKTLLPNLKADCIAIQEISSIGSLGQLVSQIPNWSYLVSGDGDGYTTVGILYNNLTVQVDSFATIMPGMSNPFPRAPLLIKLHWQGQEIILISVHLKALGDNYIDETDNYDEEVRRRYACQLLDQYVADNFSDSKVVILGDMNDQIQEPTSTNVFLSFINKPLEYLFTDMSIAQNYNSQTWSYRSSHIDHILITNELIDAFNASNRYVKTIQIENYVSGGWNNYDALISDHRPVGARFKFDFVK